MVRRDSVRMDIFHVLKLHVESVLIFIPRAFFGHCLETVIQTDVAPGTREMIQPSLYLLLSLVVQHKSAGG
jgi:hypothetical protein